jgi:hypothetical protein
VNNAQQYNNLFESWNSIRLNHEISKKFEISYEVQLRLKSQRKLYDLLFNEIDFKYEIFKNLELGFAYRFFEKNDDFGSYKSSKNFARNQFYIGFSLNKWRYILAFKAKYQIKDKVSSDRLYDVYIPKKYFRYKISLSKDFKNWKFDPKFDVEFFNRDKSYANIYEKIRFSLGTRYKFKNKNSLNIGYFYENDFTIPFKIEGLKVRYNLSI